MPFFVNEPSEQNWPSCLGKKDDNTLSFINHGDTMTIISQFINAGKARDMRELAGEWELAGDQFGERMRTEKAVQTTVKMFTVLYLR